MAQKAHSLSHMALFYHIVFTPRYSIINIEVV